jgi:hypothetical protein
MSAYDPLRAFAAELRLCAVQTLGRIIRVIALLAGMSLLATLAGLMFYGISLEIDQGVVEHKGGGYSSAKTSPRQFEGDIALQAVLGTMFAGLAVGISFLLFSPRR